VPDHGGDLGVDELLRDRRARLRVGLVVLARHLERDRHAADHQLLVVRLGHGERGAVFVVLAQVRDRAGEGARVGDGHGDAGGCRGLGGGFRLFLAAGRDAEGEGDREGELR
jgi:hypothetical protein